MSVKRTYHYEHGDRVMVLNEGPGTVVIDDGLETCGRKVYDLGVTVRLDSDGVELSAAHAQVEPLSS